MVWNLLIKIKLILLVVLLAFLFSPSKLFALTATVANSSVTTATANSSTKNIVQTSEGTIHAFIQTGTNTSTCGAGGLWWMYSTDSGVVWNCGSQISADTTNLMYGDAKADANNNIYIVYSMMTTGAGTAKDVFYRKLSKGAGSTWSVGAEQLIFDGTALIGFHYASVEVQGTTRLAGLDIMME
jgi:hypothetical protein